MKLRKDKDTEPVRLQKTENTTKNKRRINHKTLNVILLLIILFLIFFVILPLSIYNTGSLESTNYYYRLDKICTILPLLW